MTEDAESHKPLKPVIQWVGSKYRLAPMITAMFPLHTVYVEPYFGTGSVLLAKPRSTVEVVNDLDNMLVMFYRVLRDRPNDLINALWLTPHSRWEFEETIAGGPWDVDDVEPGSPLELEKVRRWFIWINQRYVMGHTGRWTVTYQGSSGHSNGSKWHAFVGRLEGVAQRLHGVQIDHRDALEIVERCIEASDTLLYLDPPYLRETRHGSSYRIEADDHHAQLLKLLSSGKVRASIMVSGYDSPLYRDALQPQGWMPVSKSLLSGGRSGRGSTNRKIEVVWVSPNVKPLTLYKPSAEVARLDR